jgi:type IV pilus biogenesis protein CpaD/CtpE
MSLVTRESLSILVPTGSPNMDRTTEIRIEVTISRNGLGIQRVSAIALGPSLSLQVTDSNEMAEKEKSKNVDDGPI